MKVNDCHAEISSEVNNLSTQIPVKHTERTSGMTEVPVTGNRKKTTEGTDQYSKSSDVSDLSRPTTNNHNEKL
ncbi:unnamed protein product [Schistosoma haematobium]|nr:unnamed protein product [Schistosoma haematobium]